MKQYLSLLLLCFCAKGFCLEENLRSLTVNAESALLMNADTGALLYEKEARTPRYPASTTKIATAAFVLHLRGEKIHTSIKAEQDAIGWISQQQKERSNYTLPAYWLEPGATHVSIKAGEELLLRDLLFAMLVSSADDASNVIANYIGGTVPVFMSDLNNWLKEIGCSDTHFVNPHGLHHPKHVTTAYDLAVMSREALKNPLFCEMVGTKQYRRPKTPFQEGFPLVQGNRLLIAGKHYYDKAIGVKTGYIAKAGHCLVAAAKENNRTLIAVLLKSENRDDLFQDAKKLFKAAFDLPQKHLRLFSKGLQKMVHPSKVVLRPLATDLKEEVKVSYYIDESPKFLCFAEWEELIFPVEKGQQIGTLVVKEEQTGRILKQAPLLAHEECILPSPPKKTSESIRKQPRDRRALKIAGGILALLLLGGVGMQLLKKR